MSLDAYAPCPCGSGKKFKWCCQESYGQIEEAFRQQANGQHEAALKKMEELTQQFATNPEVWGRRAELLWENEREEEAEAILQKAMDLNPNYAFGHYLRGTFRHAEREMDGALLLYRKAAAACDADARDLLGEVYASIGQVELTRNRPLAAHAAWEISLRCLPGNERLQTFLAQYFGDESPFPLLFRRDYPFRPCVKDAPRERRQAWQQALGARTSGKLVDAASAFEELTQRDPQDAAAWYNLGLVRAWLGDNNAAIDAMNASVDLETDETLAAEAGALAEVLRLGHGLMDRCDFVEFGASYRIVRAEPLAEALRTERRFADLQQHEGEGMIAGTILDREMPQPHENLALFELPRIVAYLVIARDRVILTEIDQEALAKACAFLEERVGAGLVEKNVSRRAPAIQSLANYLYKIRLPQGMTDEQALRLLRSYLEQRYEEEWLNRPLKSLDGASPIDAAGHPRLRKRLPGIVHFFEEVTRRLPLPYDFNRLRHKLGLATTGPSTAPGTMPIDAMGAAELATLKGGDLDDAALEQAYQSAMRLDARELAGQFGRLLIDRQGTGDRFPLFNQLVQQAAENEDFPEALDLIDRGLKHDCEHNEGRRRNEYELKRAQVFLKAKQPDEAHGVFQKLLERIPSNLDVLGTAAEGMVSARKGPYAVTFAEQGVRQAKAKGDRDRVGYFEELLAAAKRL